MPYPAVARRTAQGIVVSVLDFESLHGVGDTLEVAMESAQNALLRHLMIALRDKKPVPSPDQYLDPVGEDDVIMLDPLGGEDTKIPPSHFFSSLR